MKLSFKIRYDEPAFLISGIDGKDFIIGMSTYDTEPIKRLHLLFLLLDKRWVGYSAEEFEYEGQTSAIAFIPADEEGFSLMTVDQDDKDPFVKDVRVNNAELITKYKKAFSDFLGSMSEEQIKDVNSQNYLARDEFNFLIKG